MKYRLFVWSNLSHIDGSMQKRFNPILMHLSYVSFALSDIKGRDFGVTPSFATIKLFMDKIIARLERYSYITWNIWFKVKQCSNFTIGTFKLVKRQPAFQTDQHISERPHDMMTSSNGNIFRVTGHLCGEFTGPSEFPTQRPVTRRFDVFFDPRLNKQLSKQSWGWWFEALSRPSWRHRNDNRWIQLYFHVT